MHSNRTNILTPLKTLRTVISFIWLGAFAASAGPREDFELFRSGEKLVWDSTGHEKAKGVRLKISYPRTWKAAEGSRPNILQKFTSNSGGLATVLLMTRALPKPYDRELTASEKLEVVSRDVSKEFIPDGGRMVSHQITKVDGEVCAMLESEVTTERVGAKIGLKSLTFIIPRKGVLLMLQCSTGGDASSGFDAINKHYEEVKPLLLSIAASCVLMEKWKTP
jgi:hypothetical protein